MNTPICDFVQRYCDENTLRLHMPGHKGNVVLGMEPYDITEIDGADSLYEASGIIHESEKNAAALFGTAATFYSAEGSSLCIRAMLFLALLHAKQQGRSTKIIAGRNAHKTFVTAAGLLDLDVKWLAPAKGESYLACSVDLENLEACLKKEQPAAVYLTNPDYLGNLIDIHEIAHICKKHNVLLLVDNAHGAYLKFLPESRHPMDIGADLCCDSAHKTLPVLTGGAYLHVAKGASSMFIERAKDAMALFGSTSPSYLIMQSIDKANEYLVNGYAEKLKNFLIKADEVKSALQKKGFELIGQEPLKLTLATKTYGYLGTEFSEELLRQGIVTEFADPDYVVMMLSCEMGEDGLQRLVNAMELVERRSVIEEKTPEVELPEKVLSVREAIFSAQEKIPVSESEGRILASLNVGCPPAVPIAVCGEKINKKAVELFQYYKIETCDVVKN